MLIGFHWLERDLVSCCCCCGAKNDGKLMMLSYDYTFFFEGASMMLREFFFLIFFYIMITKMSDVWKFIEINTILKLTWWSSLARFSQNGWLKISFIAIILFDNSTICFCWTGNLWIRLSRPMAINSWAHQIWQLNSKKKGWDISRIRVYLV